MNKCDYPNHCPDLKQAGENLLKQELKITELEQQKAELIEIAKEYSYLLVSQQSYDFNNEHDLKRGEEIETLLENIT